MGRDNLPSLILLTFHHFNPRARVGRDLGAQAGASLAVDFNPRARVGRDDILAGYGTEYTDFNPRARVGRDIPEDIVATRIMISIHAPAWGATIVIGDFFKTRRISIHAPAWGATQPQEGELLHAEFQSTRPRGARQIVRKLSRSGVNFNPRARVGRD